MRYGHHVHSVLENGKVFDRTQLAIHGFWL